MPNDIMHDVFGELAHIFCNLYNLMFQFIYLEGAISFDICGALQTMVKLKWFQLDQLNYLISTFKYSIQESRDR